MHGAAGRPFLGGNRMLRSRNGSARFMGLRALWAGLAALVVLVSLATWFFAVRVPAWRAEADQARLKDRLRCFSWVLIEYEREHGEYPPDLNVDLKFHHCYESLDAYAWEGHRIRYIRPEPQGKDQAVLYMWPPLGDGTAVFYFDLEGDELGRRSERVRLTEQGQLVHPRTGDVLADASPEAPPPTARTSRPATPSPRR
jgi:hypothetical protein